MPFSPSNLRLSSPPSSTTTIFKPPHNSIDQQYLHTRLNAILFTLNAEKEQFQLHFNQQKTLLQQQIHLQSQQIHQLQSKNLSLQQQSRQLRFNYHQRGSLVDYLKKKNSILQNKFHQDKQEMLSVIKYLESRNYQLNQIIFELKQKQLELNQNIYHLQQKYFNLTNQLSFQNLHSTNNPKLLPKKPMQRKSLCHKHLNEPLTPQTMAVKNRNQRMLGSNLESSLQVQSRTLEDSNIESLDDSTIREKTVKIEGAINRAKSHQNIDFSQLNNYISLGRGQHGSKNTEVQHIPSKGILINNYGHLSFTDFPGQEKLTGIRKSMVSGRPKYTFQSHTQGKYVAQLQSKRASKQIASSHQL